MLSAITNYFNGQKRSISKKEVESLVREKLLLFASNGVISRDKPPLFYTNWTLERVFSRGEMLEKGFRVSKGGILLCKIYSTNKSEIVFCFQAVPQCINLEKSIERVYLIGRIGTELKYTYLDKNNSGQQNVIRGTSVEKRISRTELLLFWYKGKLCLVNLTPDSHIIVPFEVDGTTTTTIH